MFCIARLESVPCDRCKNRVSLACVWFKGPNAEAEKKSFLLALEKKELGPQTELIGEVLSDKTLERFPTLSGKVIGYITHDCNRYNRARKNHSCDMSGKAPLRDIVFKALLLKIKHEEENPAVVEPVEDQIATKGHPERRPVIGRYGIPRNTDLYREAEAKAGHLRRKLGILKPDGFSPETALQYLLAAHKTR